MPGHGGGIADADGLVKRDVDVEVGEPLTDDVLLATEAARTEDSEEDVDAVVHGTQIGQGEIGDAQGSGRRAYDVVVALLEEPHGDGERAAGENDFNKSCPDGRGGLRGSEQADESDGDNTAGDPRGELFAGKHEVLPLLCVFLLALQGWRQRVALPAADEE